MRYEFNVSGENRKALVKAIADFTGQKAKYNGVPSCSYSIGEITVTKDGALEYEGEEDLADLLRNLADAGFVSEQEAPQCAGELTGGNNTEEADVARQSEPTALTVEIPLDKVKVGNLTNLLDAKGELIKKALGIADLPIEILEDRVAFPWFSEADPESVKAYTHFISALCKMSMDQQRITAKAKEVDNEKYAFRCFLLRLGFIGAEYKAERKVLLKNLSGSSAFKSGQKKEAEDNEISK